MMDLREFFKVLEEEHELQKIKAEVDPKHELGAICKIHNERPNSPALLFENVKGYNDSGGRPAVGERPTRGSGAWAYRKKMFLTRPCGARASRFRPRLVASGPCQEVVMEGERRRCHQIAALHQQSARRRAVHHGRPCDHQRSRVRQQSCDLPNDAGVEERSHNSLYAGP